MVCDWTFDVQVPEKFVMACFPIMIAVLDRELADRDRLPSLSGDVKRGQLCCDVRKTVLNPSPAAAVGALLPGSAPAWLM